MLEERHDGARIKGDARGRHLRADERRQEEHEEEEAMPETDTREVVCHCLSAPPKACSAAVTKA